MSKILFIDDEKEILKNYLNIFSSNDNEVTDLFDEYLDSEKDTDDNKDKYELFSATQGEEGIQIIKEQIESGDPIKLVFVDMRMPPGMNGAETIKEIRKLDASIEFVIVTAYSDQNLEDVIDYIGTPENVLYLKKPFDDQEIKQLALCLTRKYDQQKIKDNFINSISHELKTPLSSILGFGQLLANSNTLSEEDKENLFYLDKSSKLMNALIEELIASLEIQKKGVSLIKESVDVNKFMSDMYNQLKPLFWGQEQVEFKLIDSDKNIQCEFDQLKITQCVNNLVQNAFKFTQEGQVKLGYCICDEYFHILISDSGMGMESHNLDKIFKEFHRIESDHHTIEGLGLGLSIVQKIICAHGGKISVQSELNVGSEFTIMLPLVA